MDVFLLVLALLLFTSLLLLIAICSYSICLDGKVLRYLEKRRGSYYKVDNVDDYVIIDTENMGIQPVGQKDIRNLLNKELNQSRTTDRRFPDFTPIRITDEYKVEDRLKQPDSGLPSSSYGKLCFSIRYDSEGQTLTVHLISGRQISLKGDESARWPVVNIRLIGYDEPEQQSAPDESPNPEYDQEFTFLLPSDKVGSVSVLFTIWDLHADMQKMNIGYVKVSLGNFMETLLLKDGTGPLSREIRDTEIEDIPRRKNGDILFSLTYNRESDTLSVALLKCKGVVTELEDVGLYAKVTLLVDGWPYQNKKSSTETKQMSPTFRQILSFENCIAANGLNVAELGLTVSLRAKSITGQKRVVGSAFLGQSEYSTAEGKSHWAEMLKSSRAAVAQWHPLEY